MRRSIGSLLVLILVLAVTGFSVQSQVPPPSAVEGSQPLEAESTSNTQPATSDDPKSEARVPVMKAQPAPKPADHTAEEQQHHDKESPGNWWFEGIMVAFTGVLAISTIGLWVATYHILKHTNAAERAYVTMSHRSPPGLEIENGRDKVRFVIQTKNSGRTPAHVTNVSLSWLILPKGQSPPAVPNYPPPENIDAPITAFLVANESFLVWKTFDGISGKNLAKIATGDETLWIYGYVDYIDKFGQRHRGGYARVYDPRRDTGPPEQRNNLIFVPQRGYNYDRPRMKGEGNDW